MAWLAGNSIFVSFNVNTSEMCRVQEQSHTAALISLNWTGQMMEINMFVLSIFLYPWSLVPDILISQVSYGTLYRMSDP